MSPLRWMQSTASHWTVMLENVPLDVPTLVGAAVGTGGRYVCDSVSYNLMSSDKYHRLLYVAYQPPESFQWQCCWLPFLLSPWPPQ